MGRYVFAVHSNAAEGREQEYNDWYSNHHLKDVLACPGVISARRLTLADQQLHGGPQPFTMSAVFPGFAEAMGRMQEGGTYRFSMPKSLAFGDRPAPQGFTGDKLTFDVQVRKVVRGGAAMMQMQQMQQQQQGGTPPPQQP